MANAGVCVRLCRTLLQLFDYAETKATTEEARGPTTHGLCVVCPLMDGLDTGVANRTQGVWTLPCDRTALRMPPPPHLEGSLCVDGSHGIRSLYTALYYLRTLIYDIGRGVLSLLSHIEDLGIYAYYGTEAITFCNLWFSGILC